jgi:hypothetical protein
MKMTVVSFFLIGLLAAAIPSKMKYMAYCHDEKKALSAWVDTEQEAEDAVKEHQVAFGEHRADIKRSKSRDKSHSLFGPAASTVR